MSEKHPKSVQFGHGDHPEASRFIKPEIEGLGKIGDLFLHLEDLELAGNCLHRVKEFRGDPVLSRALWHTAVIHFVKCFKPASGRSNLDAKKVFGSEESVKANLDYFVELRNNHIAHDSCHISQAVVGVTLNKPGVTPKLGHFFAASSLFDTLNPRTFRNLCDLVETAYIWVRREKVRRQEDIRGKLEAKAYEELDAYPTLEMPVVTEEDMFTSRPLVR